MKAEWRISVDKKDFVQAVTCARARATLRRGPGGSEREVMLVSRKGGLSVRSSHAAMDIPAHGRWSSPVLANGPALRRLAPKLSGPEVTLTYVAGRLFLNKTSLPAREA